MNLGYLVFTSAFSQLDYPAHFLANNGPILPVLVVPKYSFHQRYEISETNASLTFVIISEPVIPSDLPLHDEAKAVQYLENAIPILACAKQIYTVNRRTLEFTGCLENLLQIESNLKTLPIDFLNPKIRAKVSQTSCRISKYIHALQSIEDQQYFLLWRKMLILLEQGKLQPVDRLQDNQVKVDTNAEEIIYTSFEYNSPISNRGIESSEVKEPSRNLITNEITEFLPSKKPSKDPRLNLKIESIRSERSAEDRTFNRAVGLISSDKSNNDPNYNEAVYSIPLKEPRNNLTPYHVHELIPMKKPSNSPRPTPNPSIKSTLLKVSNYHSRKPFPKNRGSHKNSHWRDPRERNRYRNKLKRRHSLIEYDLSSIRNTGLSPNSSSLRSASHSSTSYMANSESQSKRTRISKWTYRENSSMSDSDREYESKRASYFSKKFRKDSFLFDSNEVNKMQKPVVQYDQDRLVNPLINFKDLDPVNDGEIPVQLLTIIPSPPEDCIFCGLGHHSHLCTKVNTLETRLAFFDDRNLCFKCGQPRHDKKCLSLEKFCKWQHCVAVGKHHSAICPKITYPITTFEVEQYFDYISAMRLSFCKKSV